MRRAKGSCLFILAKTQLKIKMFQDGKDPHGLIMCMPGTALGQWFEQQNPLLRL